MPGSNGQVALVLAMAWSAFVVVLIVAAFVLL